MAAQQAASSGHTDSTSVATNHADASAVHDNSTGFAHVSPQTCAPKNDSRADEIWARKVIVSFDGGGMRGYVSLLILHEIMKQVKIIEQNKNKNCQGSSAYPWCAEKDGKDGTSRDALPGFRPHHYVDYFVGTSTGGLSSMLLGRLQMTPDEVMAEYNAVGMKVFRRPNFATPSGLLRSRYSGGKMARALQRATTQDILSSAAKPTWPRNRVERRDHTRNLADRVHLRAENPASTRTVVVAYGGADAGAKRRETYLFRSYDHPLPSQSGRGPDRTDPGDHLNPGPACDLPLWQVGRATSAAPTYLPPMRAGEDQFVDAAVDGQNNPIKLSYNEVKQMHPSHEPLVVLSIGTGEKPDQETEEKWYRRFNRHFHDNLAFRSSFQKKVLDTQKAHLDFATSTVPLANSRVPRKKDHMLYRRFNIPASENLPTQSRLDAWVGNNGADTEQLFRRAVARYCNNPEVAANIKSCASKLVEIRRKRAESEEWERFALHLRYSCRDLPQRIVQGSSGRSSSSTSSSSSSEDEQPEDVTAPNDCKNRLFLTRAELGEHGEQAHGLVRQVECVNEHGTLLNQWTCFRRQCARRTSTFSTQQRFEQHLRDEHKIADPWVVTHDEFEAWLDRGRRPATEALNRVATSRLPAA